MAIVRFWGGIGRFDADQMKASLDWPCSIIETSADGAQQATVFNNEAKFDREFRRAAPDGDKKTRSEFLGAGITQFKVSMLNEGLASVTCLCIFPRWDEKGQKNFRATSALRKDGGRGWRIILVNIPK